ncbi:MAG: hypothetical protein ACQ9MH_27365 [Nitrospinales bacterium]
MQIRLTPINSFVAIFDVLGFKSLRKHRGTNDLDSLYRSGLLPQIQYSAALRGKTIERNGNREYVPDFGLQSLEYRIASDTILFFAKGDTFDHFLRIVAASHRLLGMGFVGHNAPLRGAIGYGDLILDSNTIWIGSAIEDASIGEKKQVWSGCALTPNCEKFVAQQGYLKKYENFFSSEMEQEDDDKKRQNLEKAKRRIVEYPIPESINPKTGPSEYTNRKGYALDWTLNVYQDASKKAFAPTDNSHAMKIIQNTTDFENWARERIHEQVY